MTPEQQALWDEAHRRPNVATAGLMPYFRDLVAALAASLGRETQVVEFGVRSGTSTIGWLAGGARLFSVDMHVDAKHKPTHDRIRAAWPHQWTFQLGNTLEVDIPECDVLFVDDLHNYEHVWAEMAKHSRRVRCAIVFHDTTSFGAYGQEPYSFAKGKATRANPAIPGVRLAIDALLIEDGGNSWRMARSEWKHDGCVTIARPGSGFPREMAGVYV